MTTITRPATSFLAELNQRLRRRLEHRASTTSRRGPARPSRPHQPFTTQPARPRAIWHIEAAELTHALKDSWH